MALSDLDFSPGLPLQDEVLAKFGSPGFLLVASFSRSAIRINEESVALQSCLGGLATDFLVEYLIG
jgi:hypothetical protein